MGERTEREFLATASRLVARGDLRLRPTELLVNPDLTDEELAAGIVRVKAYIASGEMDATRTSLQAWVEQVLEGNEALSGLVASVEGAADG